MIRYYTKLLIIGSIATLSGHLYGSQTVEKTCSEKAHSKEIKNLSTLIDSLLESHTITQDSTLVVIVNTPQNITWELNEQILPEICRVNENWKEIIITLPCTTRTKNKKNRYKPVYCKQDTLLAYYTGNDALVKLIINCIQKKHIQYHYKNNDTDMLFMSLILQNETMASFLIKHRATMSP